MTISVVNQPAHEGEQLQGASTYGRAVAALWMERSGRRRMLSLRQYLVLKRWCDVILCLALLPFVLPLLAGIALAIKLEAPGAPTIFTQYRTGRHGKRFKMYKFRTMVANAEELKLQLLHLNELEWPDFKLTNDPRITRVGRFLRRTSLDELPQIFNILKGEMSFVGPRPTSFAASTYQLWQTERLDVMPGLTGLRQIAGSSASGFDQRLRQEITYIQHRGLIFDIVLLILTVEAVVMARGR